jgi:DNA-binding NtrC family response regulator
MRGDTAKATVLVVDDDADVRELAVEMLADGGYRAIGAGGASEAIDRLSREEVDVLLTDIRMPGLSGFVLAQQAKRLRANLAVVFTTGVIPPSQWDERRNGAVLRKPYSGEQLLAAVERVVVATSRERDTSLP